MRWNSCRRPNRSTIRRPQPLGRFRPRLVALEDRCLPATLLVTNTLDAGPGSLRQSIVDSNASVGVRDSIDFNIPGGGVHTISVISALPAITDTVTINGFSQPGAHANALLVGNNAVLLIQLDGSGAGPAAGPGLRIQGGGSTIRGLAINRFPYGIQIESGGNVIAGNFIGTDATGVLDMGNGQYGIYVRPVSGAPHSADGNTIGGTSPGDRNVISGNDWEGIRISLSSNNVIQGNYIGTNAAGTAAIANGCGLYISTHDASLGGDSPADGNVIGGTAPGAGNLISGNAAQGVNVSGFFYGHTQELLGLAKNTVIQGNLIGTNAAGTAAIANAGTGISLYYARGTLIGGTTPAARNIISGNGPHGAGIQIGNGEPETTGNVIQGNYIGTDVTGSFAVPNVQPGIELKSPGNTIGGTAAGAGNLISGNQNIGLHVRSGNGSVIQGNLVGTNPAGTTALPNRIGIILDGTTNVLVGGTTAAARNVISGNTLWGVSLEAYGAGNRVQGNIIGADISGTAPLGNGNFGVVVNFYAGGSPADDNQIGGLTPASGNTIAFNTLGGVYIALLNTTENTGNLIGSNTIFSNGGWGILVESNRFAMTRNVLFDNSRLGIDLGYRFDPPNGVTPNDPGDGDTGSNDQQNYPVIASATNGGGSTTIVGSLNSTPNQNFVLEFFANVSIDPTGFGEAEQYVGSATVATDGAGNASFTVSLPTVPVGRFVTATATDNIGNTSELSQNRTVVSADPPEACAGLVSWWPAEGNALDSAGNNHGSLVNGASYAAGHVGQAFNFDGANDFVYTGTGSAVSTDLTVSAWIKTGSDSYFRFIAASRSRTGEEKGWELYVYSDNRVYFQADAGATVGYRGGLSNIRDDRWHHVVAVRSGADFYIYVDGVREDGVYAAAGGDITSGTATYIGRTTSTNDGPNTTWNGQIDELGIYDQALSPDQIRTIYQSGHGALCPADPPQAADDAYTLAEDTPRTVTAPGVLANDTDADGEPLTAILVSGPSHGTLVFNADGSFGFTPAANYYGPDSFTYKANNGRDDSNVATVMLTVNAVNDAPFANSEAHTAAEDGSLVVPAEGVLANDTDVDGDRLTALLVSGPSHGTVTLSTDGAFTYRPAADYFGADSFTYKANDGDDDSNIATVTLTVTPVNDAPVALIDGFTMDQGGILSVAAPGVLANDSDVEGSQLTSVLVNGPAHGMLTLRADGSFVYTPAANFSGTDEFVYKANDGGLDSAPVTVTIVVNPVTLGTPGKITGGGSIDERVRNFGFVVQTKVRDGELSYTGSLQYHDKALGYNLHSTSITLIRIDPDGVHGMFQGTATLNGVAGYTFTVWVEDNGEPGSLVDRFRIEINGPGGFHYDSNDFATRGGLLDRGGNIQVHRAH